MEKYLGEMEQRFAELIWQHEPLPSGELVTLAAEAFGWKKSTTYTMLKRLCERGLFANNGGQVSALLSREQHRVQQGEQLLAEGFGGSLPGFVAAFTRRNKLTAEDVAALRRMIDEYEEG